MQQDLLCRSYAIFYGYLLTFAWYPCYPYILLGHIQCSNSLCIMMIDTRRSLVLYLTLPMVFCSCSSSFKQGQGLTILEQSLDLDTSKKGLCDLILLSHFGGEIYGGNRTYYTLSSANLLDSKEKEYFMKSDSHCLIVLASGKLDTKDFIHRSKKIQMIKPVAVLLIDVQNSQNLIARFQTMVISFPVLIMPSHLKGNYNWLTSI